MANVEQLWAGQASEMSKLNQIQQTGEEKTPETKSPKDNEASGTSSL
jgi:hypothetical protein